MVMATLRLLLDIPHTGAIARIHPDSLGAYVITMASRASDVLTVEYLQRAAPWAVDKEDPEKAGGIIRCDSNQKARCFPPVRKRARL